MLTMTTYSFGEAVLVPFPFTDQTVSKKRPATVVSSNAYQTERFDLILIAVTSQVNSSNSFVEMLITDWRAAGLLKPSIIKPVLMTVEHSLVIKPLGNLQDEDRRRLQELLEEILGE